MDGILKCFRHITIATPMILAGGKPTAAKKEDWDIAMAAAIAMDDSCHADFNIGAWQCGYDDAIMEGMYDFAAMNCHCHECKEQYDAGYVEGTKLMGGDETIPQSEKPVGGLDETAELFKMICMYPRYAADEKPEGADELAFNFALCAAQAMAIDDEPDYYMEG